MVGASIGVGGGILLVPIFTLWLHYPIYVVVPVSTVCVLVTSISATPSNEVKRLVNYRLAFILELSTVLGALSGAYFLSRFKASVIYQVFGVVAFLVAVLTLIRSFSKEKILKPSKGQEIGILGGWFTNSATQIEEAYAVREKHFPFVMGASYVAGLFAGLLGIGGGALKVPILNVILGVPFRVAAATSTFMLGITAAASGFYFFINHQIDFDLASKVVMGVFLGGKVGAHLMRSLPVEVLKKVFTLILFFLSFKMWSAGL